MNPLRHVLYIIAQRVHMPVYQIEREMPVHELAEWLALLRMEARRNLPPDVEQVGVEAMAAGLGVNINGR